MKKRAVIISGGEMRDYDFYKNTIKEDDFVICADGGARHIMQLDIKPDLFLGDFDSCDYDKVMKSPLFSGCEIRKFNPEKDKTDTHIAVVEAMERGFEDIVIVACTGSRLDHSMANIGLLKIINDKGLLGEIIDEKNIIRLYNKPFEIKKTEGKFFSLLPFGKMVTGLTLKGLKYQLDDYTLLSGDSICISNEFKDAIAKVSFKDGEVLLFLSND